MNSIGGVLSIGVVGVALLASVTASAQQLGGGRRSPVPDTVIVLLPGDGTVTFNSNGTIAVTEPGFYNAGSSSAGSETNGRPPQPGGPPSFDIARSLSTFADELYFNARHCLTLVGFQCEPGTPPSNAVNYVSTQVDIRWMAERAAQDTGRDILIPDMVLRSNPPQGLVNLPTYFWVDPATYGGQTYFQQVVLPRSWTVDWDYWVTHTVSGPCPAGGDDPNATCTTITRSLQHHHEDHMDIVNVIVTLTPSHYTWTFGDEGRADFSNGDGIGVPYRADLFCCPSLVEHNYRQSSLKVFDRGGFAVHLQATWSTTAMVHATRNGAPVVAETRTLDNRVGNYDLRHQVRESQPVLVR